MYVFLTFRDMLFDIYFCFVIPAAVDELAPSVALSHPGLAWLSRAGELGRRDLGIDVLRASASPQ